MVKLCVCIICMDLDIKMFFICYRCLLSFGGLGSIYIILFVRRFKSKVIVVNWFIDFLLGYRLEVFFDFWNNMIIFSYK